MPARPRPAEATPAAAAPVRFVLVQPEHPGNLGASARALKNMGFDDLRVVGRRDLARDPEAVRMAHGAEDVLAAVTQCASLHDALAGCRWSLGTTRRQRKPRASTQSLRGLRLRLAEPGATASTSRFPLGVVFGPEKDGLSFEDLALCQETLTIPTSAAHASLNLAQAVLLVAWELAPIADAAPTQPDTDIATHEELEGMYAHLEAMLADIGFVQDETARHQMLTLRGLLSRTLPTRREVTQLRGICRQASWAARQGRK